MNTARRAWTLARRSWLDTGRLVGWWILGGCLALLLGWAIPPVILAAFPAGRQFTIDADVSLFNAMTFLVFVLSPMITSIAGNRFVRDAGRGMDRLMGSMNVGPWPQVLGHLLAATALIAPVVVLTLLVMSLQLHWNPDLTPMSWQRQGLSTSRLFPIAVLGFGLPAFQIACIAVWAACRFRSTLAVNAIWIGLWVLATVINLLPRSMPDTAWKTLALITPTPTVWFDHVLLSPHLGGRTYAAMGLWDLLAFRSGILGWHLLIWTVVAGLCLASAIRAIGRRIRPTHRLSAESVTAAVDADRPVGALESDFAPDLALIKASTMHPGGGPLPWRGVVTLLRSTGFWMWVFITGFIVGGWIAADAISMSENTVMPSSDSVVWRFGTFISLMALASTGWSIGLLGGSARHQGMAEIILRSGVRSRRLILGTIVPAIFMAASIGAAAWLGMVTAAIARSVLLADTIRLDVLAPTPVLWHAGVIVLPGSLLLATTLILGRVWTSRFWGTLLVLLVLGVPAVAIWTPWSPGWIGDWTLAGVQWSAAAPFQYDRHGIVLNRIITMSLAIVAACLSVSLLARQIPDPIAGPTLMRRVRRGLLRPTPIAGLTVAGICICLLLVAIANGRESAAMQSRYDTYVSYNLETWIDAPQPRVTSAMVRCDLHPDRGFADMNVTLRVRNDHEERLPWFAFTVSPTFENVRVKTRRTDQPSTSLTSRWSTYARMLRIVEDPAGIDPGAEYDVQVSYRLPAPAGLGRQIGQSGQPFILPGGSLLTVFPGDASVIPAMGFLTGLDPTRSYRPPTPPPSADGPASPMVPGADDLIDLEAVVTAPVGYRVNLPGRLERRTTTGDRSTFWWRTDDPIHPVFHIVGGPWESLSGEFGEVWHMPEHAAAAKRVMAAIDAAIPAFTRWFGPIPHDFVRISEFPGYTGYSQSGDSNIVLNEFAGFHQLTDDEHDLAFSTAAHEIAHQWWGLRLMPEAGPGGNVLSEGLAEYATIRLIEHVNGQSARHAYLEAQETGYLDARDVTDETPLAYVEYVDHGANAIQYQRGGWIFWMAANLIGVERHDAALRKLALDFSHGDDHAGMADYHDAIIHYALDKDAARSFLNGWIRGTEVGLVQQEVDSCVPDTSTPGAWRTRIRVRYLSEHPVPVRIALRGSTNDERATPPELVQTVSDWSDDFTAMLEFDTDFQPTTAIADPDRLVLLMNRDSTTIEVSPTSSAVGD